MVVFGLLSVNTGNCSKDRRNGNRKYWPLGRYWKGPSPGSQEPCTGAGTTLPMMNTLQLHVLRDAFHLRRKTGEDWVTWNERTMRFLRVWVHNSGTLRWSTRVRMLQYNLMGHWGRQTEDDGRGVHASPGLAARFLTWRNLKWWRRQQSISKQAGGMRHPRQFFPANTERDMATCLGVEMATTYDRPWFNGQASNMNG